MKKYFEHFLISCLTRYENLSRVYLASHPMTLGDRHKPPNPIGFIKIQI